MDVPRRLAGGLAARLAGISTVGWCIRNSNLDKDRAKFSTRVVVGLCASISKWVPLHILSCSENARDLHVACGYEAKKMRVVPNGFDLDRFKPDDDARRGIRTDWESRTKRPWSAGSVVSIHRRITRVFSKRREYCVAGCRKSNLCLSAAY